MAGVLGRFSTSSFDSLLPPAASTVTLCARFGQEAFIDNNITAKKVTATVCEIKTQKKNERLIL